VGLHAPPCIPNGTTSSPLSEAGRTAACHRRGKSSRCSLQPTPLPAPVQMTSKRRRDQLLRRPKEPSSARKKPPISSRLRRPSGLGSHFFWGLPLSIANQMTDATTVRYETIPHFPRADSSSRAGRLVIGKLADVPLAVLCGRLHYYEGLGLDAVVFPIRILARDGDLLDRDNLCCWRRKSGIYAWQPRCPLRPYQSAWEQSDDRPAGRTPRLSIRGYERGI